MAKGGKDSLLSVLGINPNDLRQKGADRAAMTGRADIEGVRVATRPMLSQRLDIPARLRIVGNAYGGWTEELNGAPAAEFLKEPVDGGSVSGGGISLRQLILRERLNIAETALRGQPPVFHKVSAGTMGPHTQISAEHLVYAVCVAGREINSIALAFGWYAKRKGKKGDVKLVLPKPQGQKIKRGLVMSLAAIDAAWSQAGVDAADEFGGVEVK